MLTSPKLTLVQELIAGASYEELIWLSGYLAGVVAQRTNETSAAVPVPAATTITPTAAIAPVISANPGTELSLPGSTVPSNGLSPAEMPAGVGKITIAYGTETGNSKKLAYEFAAKAKKKGINTKLVGLEQYRLNDLPKEEYFFTVISTQGDGEPPAAAKKFYDHLYDGSLRLDRMKYSVLALGDTAYPLFCKAGEDIDQQLQKIGGQRIASLQKCDTDYETEAGHWFDTILQQLALGGRQQHITASQLAPGGVSGSAGQSVTAGAAIADTGKVVVTPRHSGKTIYTGTVLANINLNDRGSGKRTHHLEIAAENVDYQPGDSIGIVPSNPTSMVEGILALSGVDPARVLVHRTEEWPVAHLLHKKLNVVYLHERVVKKYASIVRQEIPQTKIGLLDLLKIYPVRNGNQFLEVVSILEPIAPRLYSISSSPEAHAGEIHLTVAKDTFAVNGETKHGLCSDNLSQLVPGQTLEFYVHHNSQFRLPAPEKDIIMIGPGTGIAPFRSFLAERDSIGAPGKNWLFFGDQHFTTDFLYQTEIQDWSKTGTLTRVNTAFSRDQARKVYVQHRMQEEASGLYQWLESGAHLYLCGAKEPMSVDVENTLLEIIRKEGNRTAAQAIGYLDELKETGRFAKDVY